MTHEGNITVTLTKIVTDVMLDKLLEKDRDQNVKKSRYNDTILRTQPPNSPVIMEIDKFIN